MRRSQGLLSLVEIIFFPELGSRLVEGGMTKRMQMLLSMRLIYAIAPIILERHAFLTVTIMLTVDRTSNRANNVCVPQNLATSQNHKEDMTIVLCQAANKLERSILLHLPHAMAEI
jgi:hypothetical protein